jgi:hypothetical protein
MGTIDALALGSVRAQRVDDCVSGNAPTVSPRMRDT